MVFSNAVVRLAEDFFTSPIGTVKSVQGGGMTKSWVNTNVFLRTWEQVRDSSPFENFDWTVKVDPDTVLLPDVLKSHLRRDGLGAHEGPLYLENCAGVDMGF